MLNSLIQLFRMSTVRIRCSGCRRKLTVIYQNLSVLVREKQGKKLSLTIDSCGFYRLTLIPHNTYLLTYTVDKDALHKELDLIQNVITRMANNSFLVKGWTVSIAAVVIAISRESIFTGNGFWILGTLAVPCLAFWVLDAFYLRQEKMFRELYKWVITHRGITDEHLYSLDASRFGKVCPSVLRIMFTKAQSLFYLSVLLTLIIVAISIIINKN